MNAAGRLALYGAGLAVAFGGAFAVAGAAVPKSFVNDWKETAGMSEHGAGHDAMTDTADGGHAASLRGLSLASDGLVMSPVSAPTAVGESGDLSYRVLDEAGNAVTKFAESHEKFMHLIVVRTDGSGFQHVHPTLNDNTGVWSVPWKFDAAGTYRVFADFVPATEEAPSVTLTRTVDVAGDFTPDAATDVVRTADVDGFEVRVTGDLVAGRASELDIAVERDGQPVDTLEPYLGAFGHLVALREGDLAFLHVHAEGEDPKPDETAGPTISFMAEAPTAGRYLLYLDFQVGGQVRTAHFVLDAASADASTEDHSSSDDAGHAGH